VPRTSAWSIVAEPLNSPDSAMSTSRQFCRLASTLPSTTSVSHDAISPDSAISRPTVSLRLPIRRGAAPAAERGPAAG
jgi:hypothetical protein